jgi:alkylated DNA repair dioxygenase AlkB
MGLFGADLPEGFRYVEDFITRDEEQALNAHIASVEFSAFEMRGVVARRRVAFFGSAYDARNTPTADLPGFLFPLRARLAEWVGVHPEDFAMALINEYPPGAPIGWHRDAPQYGIVTGVSLLTPCRMKLRPYVSPSAHVKDSPPRKSTHEIELLPRSAYLMYGVSRRDYEHSIPAVAGLRYSITFRTLRKASREATSGS